MLYSAVALECNGCAKALIIGGARIDRSGVGEQTPLDTAYITGDLDLIRFMTARCASRKISDAEVARIQANRQRAAAVPDDDGDPAPAPPVYAPSTLVAPPALASQTPQSAAQRNRQTKGFERTYCVQASLVRNDTPSPNTLHVRFTNSCPIAVVIGWSARMPNGTLQGGEASGAVAPGGNYNTFLLQKTATGIRHIACSASAPGFRAVASEPDWYCSPGGD